MNAKRTLGLSALTLGILAGGMLTAPAANAQAETSSRRVVKVTLRGDPRAAAAARQQALQAYRSEILAQEQAAQKAAEAEQVILETGVTEEEAVAAPVYNPVNDPRWWFTPQETYIPNTNIRFLASPAQTVPQGIIVTQPPYGFPYGGAFGYPGYPSPGVTLGGPGVGYVQGFGYGF